MRIVRYDWLRRDFQTLELMLPRQTLEWRHGDFWKRATGVALCEFLLDEIPAERVSIDISGERPGLASELQKRLATARREEKTFRTVALVTGLFLLTHLALIGLVSE